MINSLLILKYGAACLLAVAVSAAASADTIFFDDFNDGSVTNGTPFDEDGSPIVWTSLAGFDQGSGNAATGDFLLTTPSEEVPSRRLLRMRP